MRSKPFRTILLVELLLFTALFTGLIIAVYNTYLDQARQTYQEGNSALIEGDYLTAYRRFKEIADIYRFSSLPEIADYNDRLAQSSLLIYAQFSQYQQKLEPAIQAQETFLAVYPASPAAPIVQNHLARLYLQKADQLRQFSNYPSALQIYQQIEQRFPNTILDSVIESNRAALFLQWGDELRANGDLERSIEKYTIVIDAYPHTPSLQAALAGILTAARDWRLSQLNIGAYARIIQEDLFLIDKYSQTPSAAEYVRLAAEDIPMTYDKWADSLCAKGEYASGLETFSILITQFPENPLAAPARRKVVQCYADWANHLRRTGEYETALAILGHAFDACQPALCDEQTLRGLQENQAQTYLEWGNQLRSTAQPDAAARYYGIILAGFSQTQAAPQAIDALVRLWLEKCQLMLDEGNRYPAWNILLHINHLLAQNGLPLSDKLEIQRQAVQTALQQALLEDTGSEGKALMMEALQDVCTGIPVSVLQFPFGGSLPRGGVCNAGFQLPDDLQAASPSQLRYAILNTEILQTVQICRYKNDSIVTRQQRLWKIEVISLLTGKTINKITFLGSPPPACPTTTNMPEQDQISIGDPPALNEIIFWLRSVLK